MGYRTVVILYNDHAHEWQNDPQLGQKIYSGMHDLKASESHLNHVGRVVECTHADVQTLAVIDSYEMQAITHSFWRSEESRESVALRLVRDAAEKLGYSLRKKPSKNPLEGTKAVFLGDLK